MIQILTLPFTARVPPGKSFSLSEAQFHITKLLTVQNSWEV